MDSLKLTLLSCMLIAAVAGSAIQPRILMGDSASLKKYQFFVAATNPQVHNSFGGAALITYRHALTAGKLVAGFHKWVLAYGSTKLGPQSQMTESRVAFLHPGYDATTHEHDLGIILLPSTFPKDLMKPIALPMRDINLPRYNEEGEISGFGITEDSLRPSPTDEMKTTYFTVVKEVDCPIDNFTVLEANNFCARDLFFNSRLCRGDVGNAFVTLQRGIPTLTGIASQVSDRCLTGSGHDASSFVRIQKYLDWIKALTNLD